MRSWKWLAAASLVIAAPASATVTYTFTMTPSFGSKAPSFTYVASDFITATTTIAGADLASCSTGYNYLAGGAAGTCTSVKFDVSAKTITLATSNLPSGAAFLTNFGSVGTFTAFSVKSPYGSTATIDIKSSTSAVPEPATWAMLVAGFGTLGTALRRSRRSRRAKLA